MKRTFFVILLGFLFLSGFCYSEFFYAEISPGYNFPFSQGWTWTSWGGFDNTLTYESYSNAQLGNYGWNLGGKIGFIVNSDLTVLLGFSYIFGTNSVKSAEMVYSDGSVAYNFTDNFKWSMLHITPGIRFCFAKIEPLEFFGGLGLLIGVPVSFQNSFTCDDPNFKGKVGSRNYIFDSGIGAYSELGMEYRINDTFGISFTTSVDKLSLSLKSFEMVNLSGTTYTYSYVDNPVVNNNDQTADDVKKSTSTHIYRTYAKTYTDFSDLSLKLAVTFRI